MKIVQSLWSKPGHKRMEWNKCGWPDRKYNYYSWTLSALQFRKFYDDVELVTDQAGYELLIDKLKLPYTSVKVELDQLNDYHEDLYALGKVYAYGLQDGPFIHADGDVFIWRPFDASLEQAALVCQCKEDGEDYNRWYAGVFMEIAQAFSTYPQVLDRTVSRNNRLIAANAGIIGGREMGFFREFVREAFAFIDKNLDSLHKINIDLFNSIFEQLLFHAMSEDAGLTINYLHPDFVRFGNDIIDFTGVPDRTGFIHTIGAHKKSWFTLDALEFRLKKDYPDYYRNIHHLIKTHQV
ncbi:hypothetical protein HHL17_11660 [Chitinophaga sp. G-6-1-13]|uniref:DUF6734 domain-containing protein n=1 Tax=Chitinophaga fulva TaxID=2728842 RepID=A0A848GJI8_9BACT|nr:DUF6734 family protein [Chitinophaga fulva]NML37851.1 hypothetical protein [Chitinophaga fulva]